tara:strand:+ start:36 stop:416 length:381 start_codon:yes stop_codon:yes gene_type:complete
MRIKSVGKMGNYLDTYTYNINELIKIFRSEFGKFTDEKIIPNFTVDGYAETSTCTLKFNTDIGTVYGKCTDWTIDDDGIPDRGSKRRGILTEDYTIEPFFEYYDRKVEGPRKTESEKMQDLLEPII